MTDILYKYRSLENFKNFIDIILNNRLFAAKYKDLNDPMEGQYYYLNGELNFAVRDKIKEEKGDLRICSLSRVYNNELLWSHYANGQRGAAIGVRIDNSRYEIRRIKYNGLTYIKNTEYCDQSAIEILSHKLEVWAYEQEERVFIRDRKFISVQVEEIITGRAMSNYDFSLMRDLVNKINPKIRIVRAESLFSTERVNRQEYADSNRF